MKFIAAPGVGGTAHSMVTAALTAMQEVDAGRPWITLREAHCDQDNLPGN